MQRLSANRPGDYAARVGETEPFRVLTTAEFQRLSVDQKLRYLELAFRHSCASVCATPVLAPDAAAQSESAESKI
jgi:hypothetical protein